MKLEYYSSPDVSQVRADLKESKSSAGQTKGILIG